MRRYVVDFKKASTGNEKACRQLLSSVTFATLKAFVFHLTNLFSLSMPGVCLLAPNPIPI
jgi:hypothetical protein